MRTSSPTRADARALGDATQALGEATGTAALDQWNDADGRNLAEVVAAVDRAAAVLNGRLEERFFGLRSAEVLAAELRHDAAARRPLDEAELEQVRLVDVLDRVRAPRPGARRASKANRPAVEALDDRRSSSRSVRSSP